MTISCSSSCFTPFLSTLPPSSSSSSSSTRIPKAITTNFKANHHHSIDKPASFTLNAKLRTSVPPPQFEKLNLLLFQYGAAIASVGTPAALAVTGENGGDDLLTTVISGGIVAVLYLFVVPPILMNWMRLRWYKRKFFEMYLQFMFVFIFFPGLLLWAPFVNFRKFPRDPTMEYPWSTPKDDTPLYKSR